MDADADAATQAAGNSSEVTPDHDFLELLLNRGAPADAAVLKSCLADIDAKTPLTSLRVRFARLGRLTSRQDLHVADGMSAYPGITEPRYFQADVAARIGFLRAIDALLPTGASTEALTTLFRTGSSREQASVMRTLPWLPQPRRFRSLASEAARTNDVDVFAALCIENPYPGDVMEDHAFFQVVMKSMFLDQDTTRIPGLTRRVNPELYRMVVDYRREREAAGRAAPAGVTFIESIYSGGTP